LGGGGRARPGARHRAARLGCRAASRLRGRRLNVLPPGQSGSLQFNANSTDQLRLYDRLTPLFDRVSAGDLRRSFKSERFGLGREKPVRVDRPRAGVRILRDRWGVPHVYGRSRADVMFGAGYATFEDRWFLMTLLRGPGRIAVLDVPGLDAFGLVGSGREVAPSAATEAFLSHQFELVRAAGPSGRQLIRDIDAYLAGINAYGRRHSLPRWTRNDVVATLALLAASFGANGGQEAVRSEFMSALMDRVGEERGRIVWNDLRQLQDPEAPVSVDGVFPYGDASGRAGNPVIDDGSFVPAGPAGGTVPIRRGMSNALLVSARRSATGHPLFVAGPQVGYYYPELLVELDLHCAGIDVRGASFPGLSFYLLVGRGKDFAWSTTAGEGLDNVDQFVETLCGDDSHYLFRGECRAMETFDAGVLRGRAGEPDRPLVFRQTVHGPVVGYATVGGRRVAIARARSTRGRELLSTLGFQAVMSNRVNSARSFMRSMSQVELTLNWFYADDRDIAMYSSGRLPVRAPGVDPGLPTAGTGEYEWRGFLPFAGHVRGINPSSGTILNWNNKPGRGFASSDDRWNFGPVHRVDLLRLGLEARRRHTLASVVAAMNRAATQDLRAVRVLPAIAAVLTTGPATSPRAEQALSLLEAWRVNGASRLDRDLDGKIDDPGAAILDAAWPTLANAVMKPVLGPLVDRLATLIIRDRRPNPTGNAYGNSGWYSYVEKDLRTLLGRPVRQPYTTRFCGGGDLAACRASLWAALEEAAAELALVQGPDPQAWRADATRERIRFAGFLPDTMRWTNREPSSR
jgi:acyl-homoserine lactone acylase PvdQ